MFEGRGSDSVKSKGLRHKARYDDSSAKILVTSMQQALDLDSHTLAIE